MTTKLTTVLKIIFLWLLLCLKASLVSAEIHTVQLVDFMFEPMDLTIHEGDSVRWIWNTDNHNIVSGLPFGRNGAFETTVENTGFVYEVRFDRLLLNSNRVANNKYDYYCAPHLADNMMGSISVLRTETSFSASPSGWQHWPPVSSPQQATCSALLNANQTQVVITCQTSLSEPHTLELRHAPLGSNGERLCSSTQPNGALVCDLSVEEVEWLFGAELFLNITTSSNPEGLLRGQLVLTNGQGAVNGHVRTPEGLGIQNSLVRVADFETTTDANGFFSFPPIANGVYQVTATKPGVNLVPDRGSDPVVINSSSLNNRLFFSAPAHTCGLDSDRDTYCDLDELNSGSNPEDRGSFPKNLRSPTHVLWNGYLRMINILELVNTSLSEQNFRLRLYSISGNELSTISVRLASRSQQDIILNDLPGFTPDSYGILRIENQSAGESLGIDGRIFFYRPDSQGGFEFAFGVPLTTPSYGSTAVTFNTYQPSTDAQQSQHLVAQWLSIANLDEHQAQTFSIQKYDQTGNALAANEISVPPFGRVDLEAGHLFPGPSKVGLVNIVPRNSLLPYLAHLTRYGGNAPPGITPQSYAFAFVLPAAAGNGTRQIAYSSRGAGADNWLEIANTLPNRIFVSVRFFSSSGQVMSSTELPIPGFSQHHFNAGATLAQGQTGTVSISADQRGSLIGQSMFYFRNSESGQIQAMYGSTLKEQLSNNQLGSYNLFLGMYNWLKIANTSSSSQQVRVTLYPPGGLPKHSLLSLSAYSSTDLGLHEFGNFGTSPDTYGVVSVDCDTPTNCISELLRVRADSFAQIDFAAPTPLR